MAQAVIDFVWQQEDLRPTGKAKHRAYVTGVAGRPVLASTWPSSSARCSAERKDSAAGRSRRPTTGSRTAWARSPTRTRRSGRSLGRILRRPGPHPDDRSLLVLPAVTQPARRAIAGARRRQPADRGPAARGGDRGRGVVQHRVPGRGRGLAGPGAVHPVGVLRPRKPRRVDKRRRPADTASLHPPSATDDVLLFAEMIRVVRQGPVPGRAGHDRGPAGDADPQAGLLRARTGSGGPARASTWWSSARSSARAGGWRKDPVTTCTPGRPGLSAGSRWKPFAGPLPPLVKEV